MWCRKISRDEKLAGQVQICISLRIRRPWKAILLCCVATFGSGCAQSFHTAHGAETISRHPAIPFDRCSVYWLATSVAAQAYLNTFTQDAEREADRIAVETLIRARFDPHAMISMFEPLQQETAGGMPVPPFLNRHPATDERIRDLRSLIPAHSPPPARTHRIPRGELKLRPSQPQPGNRGRPNPQNPEREIETRQSGEHTLRRGCPNPQNSERGIETTPFKNDALDYIMSEPTEFRAGN